MNFWGLLALGLFAYILFTMYEEKLECEELNGRYHAGACWKQEHFVK